MLDILYLATWVIVVSLIALPFVDGALSLLWPEPPLELRTGSASSDARRRPLLSRLRRRRTARPDQARNHYCPIRSNLD